MTYVRSFASASRKYRPTGVRILFIAEAPPAVESRRFFYFANLRQGDTLFLETDKTQETSSLNVILNWTPQ